MKILGGGVWALRRHGGIVVVVIYGVKRRDFKKMRALLAAARGNICTGYLYWGCDVQARKIEQSNNKKRFRISDRRRGEKREARSSDKKRGPQWDSNPRGYEQEIGPAH
jgi:hypothetical protein